MPKISKSNAPRRGDHGPVCELAGDIHDYTIAFLEFRQDIDATPLLKGLPEDRCQCAHWGYVLKGRFTMRYAGGDEVYEAGDAYYCPPGHVPVSHEPGTEFLMFSPAKDLLKTEAVMMANMKAMMPK